MLKKYLKKLKGQGMTEYLLIIGVIVLAAAVAIAAFGDQIKAAFQSLADQIGKLFGT